MVGGTPFDGAQYIDQSCTKVEAQPIDTTPTVEVLPILIVTQSAVAQPFLSAKEQKIQGRFLRLAQPMFFGALGEDVCEFMIVYEDRLNNLGLVEIRRANITNFQLDFAAGLYWRDQLDSKLVRSYPFT